MVKNLPANAEHAGDTSSILEWGRSPGGGNGNPLLYSCLGNPMDRGACQAIVHGVAKSQSLVTKEQQQLCLRFDLIGPLKRQPKSADETD